ncbi:MAG: pyrroloquinoline quinone biosynthesis protein PqqE [Myxococcota bacterium]
MTCAPAPPMALLAELTHRCPLACAYCSNPVPLTAPRHEITTAAWCEALDQAADLGVLQVHFSGGEPAVRGDLETLVAHASKRGLYTNLITSGIGLDDARCRGLARAGLEHVQLSVQGGEPASADGWAGREGAHAHKGRIGRAVGAAGLPLTLNWVVHRHNAAQLPEVLERALSLGARRLEVAHVQYAGWARLNHDVLLPSRAQHEALDVQVRAARESLRGKLVLDYVPSDAYAGRPKACMDGWGRRFVVVAPDGMVLPCHDARRIDGLRFERVTERPLAEIWRASPALQRFRGTDWMPEPCRSCDRRELDWGGCRCQAHALTGDASRTDPACALSPDHPRFEAARSATGAGHGPAVVRRRFGRPGRRALPVLASDRGRSGRVLP